jgi:PAS domain S-box-containing protein
VRTSAAPRLLLNFPERRLLDATPPLVGAPHPATLFDLQREADRAVLTAIAPPGVVVTDDLAVVQFRGQTGPYLEPSPGVATLDLLRLARTDLRAPLRQAIDEARAGNRVVRAKCNGAGAGGVVELEIVPFSQSPAQNFFVVMFRELPRAAADVSASTDVTAASSNEGALAEELASTRRYLESVIEQAEASNEELKAANEEIVSSNEELRSMNEELQTAKEELQATNEELRTVNAEMNERNNEASRLNDDLLNVLSSVEIPIVLLGRDARVRRFTPAAAGLFHLVASDVGRPFGDLRSSLTAPELPRMITDVLEQPTPTRKTVQDEQGRWFELLVRPYLTTDRRIDGVVVTAVDVDAVKRGTELLAESKAYAEGIVDTIRESLIVLEPDRRVRSANLSFFHAFSLLPDETVGRRLGELARGVLDAPELRTILDRIERGDRVDALPMDLVVAGIRRSFVVSGCRIERTPLTLLALQDVTERRRMEEALHKSEIRFRDVLTNASEAVLMSAVDGRIVFANAAASQMFGYPEDELVGLVVEALVPERLRDTHPALRARYLESPASRRMRPDREVSGRKKDGTEFPIEVVLSTVAADGAPLAVAFISDISARRESERAIGLYQTRLQAMAFDAAVAEEAERRQIAVELHDRIGQALALAQIRLTSARATMPEPARHEVEQAVELLEQCNVDVRSLMFDLSPPVLYDLGLKEALSWLAEDIERRFGLRVELISDEPAQPLDDTAAALLFRGVRELLMNVVKHAKAPTAKVSLVQEGDHVAVEVADRGIGFDPADVASDAKGGGFGLFSVREQIVRLGGAFEVQSSPGAGTRIRLRIPAKRPQVGENEVP